MMSDLSNTSEGAADLSQDPMMDKAISFVLRNKEGLDVTDIGKLRLPRGSNEAIRCKEIKSIIEDYSRRSKVDRPLSIVVFGPPGSGKSHWVREIVGSIPHCSAPFLVNLSQLSDPKDLAEAFTKTLGARRRLAWWPSNWGKKDVTSVFFFDEFDAPLGTVSSGWLRWFLAPMQDGEFFFGGKSIQIGKTVFIFAGGTAPSLEEFEKRFLTDPADYRDYRDKKVPDFISRLRGFIDIQGINNFDNERIVRRALVLRHLIEKRWPDEKSGDFPIAPEHVRKLLSNVHFVHGARSMEALLDMCRLSGVEGQRQVQLPHQDLMKLHLSRGVLDGKVIGISASQDDPEAEGLLRPATDVLLQNGAILAYGGDFFAAGTLRLVVDAAKRVPDELIERTDKRIRNYLGFPSFRNPDVEKQLSEEKKHVDFLQMETLSPSERADLGVLDDKWFRARPEEKSAGQYNPKHHLAWALSLFRMRVRLIQDINALIVVGGKDGGTSWGRFSGIAEEVMLAIALGKPVYILGDRGGGALAVGRLLGLGETIANPDVFLADTDCIEPASLAEKYAKCFTIPGHSDLPRTIQQLRDFLFERSMTTPAWPWNGLSPSENRELFRTEISASKGHRGVDLIFRGLQRLDWKLPSRPPD